MPDRRRVEGKKGDDHPREFGKVHQADRPRSGWQSLGTSRGRKRLIMKSSEGLRDGS